MAEPTVIFMRFWGISCLAGWLADHHGVHDRYFRCCLWLGFLSEGLLSGFGIQLPAALNGTFNPKAGTYVDLLPILVLVFVTGVVLLNSKAALRFNSALVVLKFSALASLSLQDFSSSNQKIGLTFHLLASEKFMAVRSASWPGFTHVLCLSWL